jgi:hypothetical protein
VKLNKTNVVKLAKKIRRVHKMLHAASANCPCLGQVEILLEIVGLDKWCDFCGKRIISIRNDARFCRTKCHNDYHNGKEAYK